MNNTQLHGRFVLTDIDYWSRHFTILFRLRILRLVVHPSSASLWLLSRAAAATTPASLRLVGELLLLVMVLLLLLLLLLLHRSSTSGCRRNKK